MEAISKLLIERKKYRLNIMPKSVKDETSPPKDAITQVLLLWSKYNPTACAPPWDLSQGPRTFV